VKREIKNIHPHFNLLLRQKVKGFEGIKGEICGVQKKSRFNPGKISGEDDNYV